MATTSRARSKAAKADATSVAADETTATSTISLQDVIEASKSEVGFLYTPASFHESLVESGDVEINTAMIQEETGFIATRATAKHLTEENTMTEQIATPAIITKPKFEIEDGVPIPTRVRVGNPGAGRAPSFPFDDLAINQSFFVADKLNEDGTPVLNEKGEAHSAYKSMQSTVNSANVRYREEIPGQTRVLNRGKGAGRTVTDFKQTRLFKAYPSERNGVKGVRIFRVAVE